MIASYAKVELKKQAPIWILYTFLLQNALAVYISDIFCSDIFCSNRGTIATYLVYIGLVK